MEFKNHLANEKSLYLQQHAANPVDWYPWGEEALDKAKNENKLLFISIGYSSCHWCHVMAHEVFEKQEAADYLNEFFVSIKVDREERPDIDNVYMTAVQLMGQNGGWPLNCFRLPDGRPVFGGTYLPLTQFMNLIRSLVKLKGENYPQLESYAANVDQGLAAINKIPEEQPVDFRIEKLELLVNNWEASFDYQFGGGIRAPKFPLPNNYEFLLNYALRYKNDEIRRYVHLTVQKILRGGIYDQIAGGLMRYSTDSYWKVPHFEKMLYDNAQFLSLVAKAEINSPHLEYEYAMKQTISWLDKNMKREEGLYKASVDADSGGGEGLYYVWTRGELEDIFEKDFKDLETLYPIDEQGFWQEGEYILLRKEAFEDLAERIKIPKDKLIPWVKKINDRLLFARDIRPSPGIDDKVVFAWNCMLAIGLVDVAIAIQKSNPYKKALDLTKYLEKYFIDDEYIYRISNEENQIRGFLDDYAFYISLCIKLHQYSLEEKWLDKAVKWLSRADELFGKHGFLFQYAHQDQRLITQTVESNDNVIPASNSVLANCYWDLGVIFGKPEWLEQAKKMLQSVYKTMDRYGSSYSNWAILLQKILNKDLLVSYFTPISDEEHHKQLRDLQGHTLFKREIQSAPPDTFQICHNMRCEIPQQGFDGISNQLFNILDQQ